MKPPNEFNVSLFNNSWTEKYSDGAAARTSPETLGWGTVIGVNEKKNGVMRASKQISIPTSDPHLVTNIELDVFIYIAAFSTRFRSLLLEETNVLRKQAVHASYSTYIWEHENLGHIIVFFLQCLREELEEPFGKSSFYCSKSFYTCETKIFLLQQ